MVRVISLIVTQTRRKGERASREKGDRVKNLVTKGKPDRGAADIEVTLWRMNAITFLTIKNFRHQYQ